MLTVANVELNRVRHFRAHIAALPCHVGERGGHIDAGQRAGRGQRVGGTRCVLGRDQLAVQAVPHLDLQRVRRREGVGGALLQRGECTRTKPTHRLGSRIATLDQVRRRRRQRRR